MRQFIKQTNYFFGRLVNNRNIVLRVFKRIACTQTLFYGILLFFRSFQKHRRARESERESKSEARERAQRARNKNEERRLLLEGY